MTDTRIIDMHVHSSASDGTFTPAALLAEAKKAGLAAMALTDHDTMDGIAVVLQPPIDILSPEYLIHPR